MLACSQSSQSILEPHADMLSDLSVNASASCMHALSALSQCLSLMQTCRHGYSALSAHSALTSATGASTTGSVGGRGPRLASAPRVVLGEHQHQGLLRHCLPHHEHQGSIVAIRMGLFEQKKMKNVQIFKSIKPQFFIRNDSISWYTS